MVRDHDIRETLRLQSRVDKIAEAAAMMTGTTLRVRFIDGCSDTVPNRGPRRARVPQPRRRPAPGLHAGGPRLRAAPHRLVSGTGQSPSPGNTPTCSTRRSSRGSRRCRTHGAAPIKRFVLPYRHTERVHMGSSDVGDVSWQTPTVQIYAACRAAGSPGTAGRTSPAGRVPSATRACSTQQRSWPGSPPISSRRRRRSPRPRRAGAADRRRVSMPDPPGRRPDAL